MMPNAYPKAFATTRSLQSLGGTQRLRVITACTRMHNSSCTPRQPSCLHAVGTSQKAPTTARTHKQLELHTWVAFLSASVRAVSTSSCFAASFLRKSSTRLASCLRSSHAATCYFDERRLKTQSKNSFYGKKWCALKIPACAHPMQPPVMSC